MTDRPWAASDRRQRLPANWEDIRAQVKRRANGLCEYTNHHPKCTGIGTDADHITPGDNHHPDNLQWLSYPCHKRKTATETANRNRARAAARTRPTEPHPGRRTT